MAEKRMISKSISISEKVNMLPDVFDMLLFTWIIPHTDDFGRLTGSPAKVKALVVPMLDKSMKDVERSIKSLHDAGLIIWYQINTDKYIQVINFDNHQQGLHKRTKSKFPEPQIENTSIPEYSRNFPEFPPELNRTEQKGTEGKGTEGHVSDAQQILNWINKYELSCKGTFQLDEITSYLKLVEIEVIEAAIKQSEKKSVSYAMSILDRFKREGKTTKESLNTLKVVPSGQGRLDFVDNL
ncbi:hypothetical protein [Paenibacillus polymyxa]|uniref:hypothetical protein n=1 Tax=Paenibacillus polymyxa TaxID=1406 RepID=UPI00041616E8|nr:hypothetical protein [Paenibacillus polymyxa]